MRSRILWVMLALVAFLGIRLAQSFVAFKQEDERMATFAAQIDAYLRAADQPVSGTAPYLRGQLVTIDADKRIVDPWTYPKLPDELRADRPEEVGTVALIRWNWQRIGDYVDQDTGDKTGEAYRSLADVVLIDLATQTVVGRETFEGERPAGGLTHEGDFHSERPVFTVLDYLEQLPRQ